MKIALVTDGIYPFVLGGMQKHSYYLAKYFSKFKHQVTIFHFAPESAEDKLNQDFTLEELENIQFVNLPFPKSDGFPGHYVRSSIKYSKSIYNYILKNEADFDIIYTKGFTGYALLKNKHKFICPIGVQLHGLEMFQKGGNLKQWGEKKMLSGAAKHCLKNADIVFSYGGKIQLILKELAIPTSKIILQHGAANDYWLQAPNNEKKYDNSIAFVGRYEHRKGHHLVNEVMPQIKQNFILNLIGEVPQNKRISHPSIHYLGNKTASEVMQVLRNCTYLLTPSLAEGFPTIIVEAMAQGLIPLATNVGAVSEIVNEKNGLLFDAGSAEQLKNTLEKALSLPLNKRKQLSEAARKQVEDNFNWNQAAHKLLKEITHFCDSWKRANS